MKSGIAPAPMTTCVCSDVPDAMSARSADARLPVTLRLTREGPSRFKLRLSNLSQPCQLVTHLNHGVLAGKKLDEAGHDAALDDSVDRWVLLFGQESIPSAACLFSLSSHTHFLNLVVASSCTSWLSLYTAWSIWSRLLLSDWPSNSTSSSSESRIESSSPVGR